MNSTNEVQTIIDITKWVSRQSSYPKIFTNIFYVNLKLVPKIAKHELLEGKHKSICTHSLVYKSKVIKSILGTVSARIILSSCVSN